MPTLDDVPEDVIREHVLPLLPLEDIISLLKTSTLYRAPIRSSKVWEVAFEQLTRSNAYNLYVEEALANDEGAAISEHLLSDPRLGKNFPALDAITRFQMLAFFCRASVGHFRALHDIKRGANWTFSYSDVDLPITARERHIKRLCELEKAGQGRTFSRYNVMANLIKLNLAQDELCSSHAPSYWYDRLGDPLCDPFGGSSYRDTLCTYFVDSFVDDGMGDGDSDPALAGVEVGSNTHLVHLTKRSSRMPLSVGLFGDKLLRNFLLLEAARASLPQIIKELEEQEDE